MNKEKKDFVIDRYSIIVIMFAVSIILFFVLVKTGKIKLAALPLGISTLLLIINTTRPGRIRRNDYAGQLYFKGENDCGLNSEPKKHVDGIYLKGKYYKTANGTDIKIDKTGNVKPVGFGSKMINSLSGAGYLNEAPDECWLIK